MTSSSSSSSSVVVLITGGGGFLGQCLASHLLESKTLQVEDNDGITTTATITNIILADIFFPEQMQPKIQQAKDNDNDDAVVVTMMQGDISDTSYVNSLYEKAKTLDSNHLSIFHLGAVMSGDGERDFDLCMRVNLYGVMHLLEGARHYCNDGKNDNGNTTIPKLILASAGATIGSGTETDYIRADDTISDATRATPHTTYGMTKACCELLVSDYGRRKFVNARALRLPTIVVRAGKPNAATTSCFSSILREPLSGVDAVNMPLDKDVKHAMTAKRNVISAMMTLHNASSDTIEQVLGFDRTVFLPAVALSLHDLHTALLKMVSDDTQKLLGKVTYEVDERLSAIVGSFPTKVDASRALKLGIPAAPTAEQLIREYIEDFPEAIVKGLKFKHQEEESTTSTVPPTSATEQPVAVITGAGSGIGQAVAIRLAQGGWNIVLAGRRLSTLEETLKQLVPNTQQDQDQQQQQQHLVVPTDVTKEEEVQQLFERTFQTYGRIDVLFNNAGINCGAKPVLDIDTNDFTNVMETNVTGPFMCAKYAMQYMKNNGVKGGRIINNGSISAHTPRPGSAPYTCSKHAILGLTKCLALDGRPYNVACGQIDFGNVVSEMSLATNTKGSGALQPNGTRLEEPSMTLGDAAETVWTMVNLPLTANILNVTVMATQMPFVGRG